MLIKLHVLSLMIYHLLLTLYPNTDFLLGLENGVERGEKDREFQDQIDPSRNKKILFHPTVYTQPPPPFLL